MSEVIKFGVIGDIHGNFRLLKEILEDLKRQGCQFVLSTGDTAFISSTKREYVRQLLERPRVLNYFEPPQIFPDSDNVKEAVEFSRGLIDLPLPVLFVGGNHEDFEFLRSIDRVKDPKRPRQVGSNFFYLGRLGLTEVLGVRIAFLSGVAPPKKISFQSDPEVQPPYRHRFFFLQDVNRFLSLVNGKKVDVLLCHDFPRIRKFGSEAIKFIIKKTRPRFSFHGHLHYSYASRRISPRTIAVGLEPIFSEGSYVILRKRGSSLRIENVPDDWLT